MFTFPVDKLDVANKMKKNESIWKTIRHAIQRLGPRKGRNVFLFIAHQTTCLQKGTEGNLVWTQDVLRHSFGTYYYNLTHDLNQVSHDMGNGSAVCKKHYVREVKKADCEKFWGLHPKP
jgi:hypothetical protein